MHTTIHYKTLVFACILCTQLKPLAAQTPFHHYLYSSATMSGDEFMIVVLLALTWSSTSFASDVPKAQVSLLNSPHLLQRRQAGPGGQQPPPACDFAQILAFVNTSQCYNTLLEDAFQNPSNNETTPGQLAEQYCTQSCAGNFINFVMNSWNCTTSLKDIYRLTVTRICSKNDGRRCITYSFTDISLTGCQLAANPTNPMCPAQCRDGILTSVNEAGCCLALEIALIDAGISAAVIDAVLDTCDIQLPAPCPLDFAAARPGNGENGNSGNGDTNSTSSNSSLSMLFVATFVVMVAIIVS